MIFTIHFTCKDLKKEVDSEKALEALQEKYDIKYSAQYRALKILGEARVCDYSEATWTSGMVEHHMDEFHALRYTPDPLVEKLGSPGTDIVLDIIERHPELEGIDIAKINVDTSCPINGHNKVVSVDFDMALKSKLFKGRTQITVLVPEGFMTRFVELVTTTEYHDRENQGLWDTITKKQPDLYRSTSRYVYHIDQVLAAWSDAGFPMDWR